MRVASSLLILLIVLTCFSSIFQFPPFYFPTVQGYTYALMDSHTNTTTISSNGLRDEHPSDSAGLHSAEGIAFRTGESNYVLGYVDWYIEKSGSPTGDLVVCVQGSTGNVGSTAKPNSTKYAWSDLIDASTISTSAGWVTFNFSTSSYTMIANNNYTITLQANSTNFDLTNKIIIYRDTDDVYDLHDSNRVNYVENAWVAPATGDELFRLYGRLEDVAPDYQNVSSNASIIDENSWINLYAQWNDSSGGLDYAWLATNESGSWANYTNILQRLSYSLSSVRFVYGNDSELSDTYEDQDPDLYVASNGSVVLTWTHKKTVWERLYAKSDDRGQTWSDAGNWSSVLGLDYNQNVSRYGIVKRHPTGKYILIQKTWNGSLYTFQSDDGFAWANCSLFWTNVTAPTVNLAMSDILVLQNNDTLIINTDYYADTFYVNKSTNRGNSWSQLSSFEHDPVGAGEMRYAQLEQFANGTVIATWFHGGATNIFRTLSPDYGVSWSSNSTLHNSGNADRSFLHAVCNSSTVLDQNAYMFTFGREDNGSAEDGQELNFAYWDEDGKRQTAIDGFKDETEPHFHQWNTTDYLIAFRADTSANGTGADYDVYVFDLTFSFPIAYSMQDLGDTTALTWTNFTWRNAETPAGTTVAWRIYCNDTGGNTNMTDIMTFEIEDVESPTSSDIAHNTTQSGASATFSCSWLDNGDLSGFTFSTNNSGTWTNDTWSSLGSNPAWSNVSKTLNASIGLVVGYRWYCNDTSDNWGDTTIQTLTTTDTDVPVSSLEASNSTEAGGTCQFSTYWTNLALSGYIFGWNNSGSWNNETWVDEWTGTPSTGWSNVSKTLNVTLGLVVGWRIYANDSSDNWGDTGIQSLTITDSTAPSSSDIAHNSTESGDPILFVCLWTDIVDLSGFTFSTNNSGTWTNDTWSSLGSNPAWANVTKTLNVTIGLVVGYRWFCNDTSDNWGDTGIQSLTTTSSSTWFYFQWNFRDVNNLDVETKITWILYNGSTALSYVEGAVSISTGSSYVLKTYYKLYLLDVSALSTGSNGNTTTTINLAMLSHASVSGGYLCFNHTYTTLSYDSSTPTNLTFTVSGTGAYRILVDVVENATYIQKDGVNQTGWNYDSTNRLLSLNTSSLSVWEYIFPESVSGGSTGGGSTERGDTPILQPDAIGSKGLILIIGAVGVLTVAGIIKKGRTGKVRKRLSGKRSSRGIRRPHGARRK